MTKCNVCGEGTLKAYRVAEPFEYKGHSGQVYSIFSRCDYCRSEVVDSDQMRENKRAVVRFKKAIERVPLGAEIVKMRERHKISQQLAGEILGGGPVAFSKYENDDLVPDQAMANLLYLATTFPDTVQRLAQWKGVAVGSPTPATSSRAAVWQGKKHWGAPTLEAQGSGISLDLPATTNVGAPIFSEPDKRERRKNRALSTARKKAKRQVRGDSVTATHFEASLQ